MSQSNSPQVDNLLSRIFAYEHTIGTQVDEIQRLNRMLRDLEEHLYHKDESLIHHLKMNNALQGQLKQKQHLHYGLVPIWYTESEGGTWKKFPQNLWCSRDWMNLKQRHKRSVTFTFSNHPDKSLQVHAIAFDNPDLGICNFPRWDCISGINL